MLWEADVDECGAVMMDQHQEELIGGEDVHGAVIGVPAIILHGRGETKGLTW